MSDRVKKPHQFEALVAFIMSDKNAEKHPHMLDRSEGVNNLNSAIPLNGLDLLWPFPCYSMGTVFIIIGLFRYNRQSIEAPLIADQEAKIKFCHARILNRKIIKLQKSVLLMFTISANKTFYTN
ncbi:hypothetical protein J11TS1_13100 [Oceanobacillus sp. J11TS1]|nr:hypothetical protein J11TS1_13100 [Oceanobacillus sp. J11TS1]